MFVSIEHANAQYLAKIHGKVTDTIGIPIEGASVVVSEIKNIGTSTNESGRYELLVPHDKDITIEITCVGYQSKKQTINVPAGKRKQLNIELQQTSVILTDFVLNERYTFNDGMEKITPKTYHFPFGSVEIMAISASMGGHSNNDLSSQYSVRGGNYDENLIYLNGIEIYRPFLIRSGQQEGLSFINPDLVSGVKFSSGGFSPCYGDKMSSVLDVQYKKPTRFGGSLSGSLLGASGHLEGMSKDSTFTVLFGARYQSNAYLFQQLQTKGRYNPTFTDGQLLLTYTPVPKWQFTLLGNYARNVYRLIPDSSVTRMGSPDGAKECKVFYQGQEVDAYQTVYTAFVAKYNASKNTDLRFLMSYFNSTEKETFDLSAEYFIGEVNTNLADTNFGQVTDAYTDVGSDIYHARNFLISHIFHGEFQGEHRLKSNFLSWGTKFQGEIIDDQLKEWRLYDSSGYTLPHYYGTPGEDIPFGDSARIITAGNTFLKTHNNLQTFRLSGFVQDKWHFGDSNHRFILIGGIRMSYWTFNHNLFLTPRLRLLYQPKIKADISFYVASGLYYQPSFYKEMRLPDGTLNKNIKPQKSCHIIWGMDYLFKIKQSPFKFSTEIYYKYLFDMITYTMDNVRTIYSGSNDATGHIAGIDAKLSGEIVSGLESWIVVSLMRGVESINKAAYTPRPTDQRFSLNLFFQDKVPKLPMLKAHISIVYATSLPDSPPMVRRYDDTIRSRQYFKTDIGFSWQFIDGVRRTKNKNGAASAKDKNPFRFLKAGYLTFEVSNIFDYGNILSYSWVSTEMENLDGKYFYKIPNYMSPRLFNVKLRFEF
jgi:hypothetical protein